MATVLYVYAAGSPPLEKVIPQIAAVADVHLVAFSSLPRAHQGTWPSCTVSTRHVTPDYETDLVEILTQRAKQIRAQAIMTFSELAVLAVAKACLQLGLAGAGERVLRAQDKRLTRKVWRTAGLPAPRFEPVSSETQLYAATLRLHPPLALEYAWPAGGVPQHIVRGPGDTERIWAGARAMARSAVHGSFLGLTAPATQDDFLVEETAQGGAGDDGPTAHLWDDCVAVEGIVADGDYHPMHVSGRLRTRRALREQGAMPSVLSDVAQARAVDLSRAGVNALGLSTCPVRTEIKAGPDGTMWAASATPRFSGAMAVQQQKDSSPDGIALLTRALLGLPVQYPRWAHGCAGPQDDTSAPSCPT
jgi:hypothetical protein